MSTLATLSSGNLLDPCLCVHPSPHHSSLPRCTPATQPHRQGPLPPVGSFPCLSFWRLLWMLSSPRAHGQPEPGQLRATLPLAEPLLTWLRLWPRCLTQALPSLGSCPPQPAQVNAQSRPFHSSSPRGHSHVPNPAWGHHPTQPDLPSSAHLKAVGGKSVGTGRPQRPVYLEQRADCGGKL